MSRLGAERSALLAALEAAGVRTATSGKLAGPCVLVEPGDPWSDYARGAGTRGRVGRWRLTAIAGAVDTLAAYDELAELFDRVDGALLTIAGPQLPTWARPTVLELGDGVKRPASIATIQYASS